MSIDVCYRLIGELLLHPRERNAERIVTRLAELGPPLLDAKEHITEFLAHPQAASADEFVQTLELAPPCHLYLGGYLFDEPTTCNGVGTSGRNAYMLELSAIYRHFGFEACGGELPDYLPIVVDFMWISLEHAARDRIGLRRRFVELCVQPALEPLRQALAGYQSPYGLLISALQIAAACDVTSMGDAPVWRTPEDSRRRHKRLLRVIPSGTAAVPVGGQS